jgi:polysaccharide pyruvyl transferase CsaB
LADGSRVKAMFNILLCGYYGFGNAGDEAILEIIVENIHRKIKECNITVLTNDIGYTGERNRLRCIQRMKFSDVAREIRKCDAVVFGGGSLFQDITSFRSILYYSGICLLSRLYHKKYILAFQGLGPINRTASRIVLKNVLRKAYYVSLRDKDSVEYAKSLAGRDCFYAADPAFLLTGAVPEKDPDKKYKDIAFIIKDTNDGKLTSVFAQTANMLRKELNANIFHMALYPEQDKEAVLMFSKSTDSACIGYDSTQELINRLGSMDLVFGTRYHSLVFSACAGTRCIPVSYDPKVTSLYKELGIKGFENSDKPDPDILYKLAVEYLSDSGHIETGSIRARSEAGMKDFLDILLRIAKGEQL